MPKLTKIGDLIYNKQICVKMGCSAISTKRKTIEYPFSGDRIEQIGEIKIQPGVFVKENKMQFQEVYRIKDVIGRGSYGEVRTCVHRETGAKRAVKIFRKDLLTNETQKARLEREITILKTLDHPNVARVYEFFEDSKRFLVVMEYCSGGELFERISSCQSFTETQAAHIMYQLFSAVAYLHKSKIIHRDLKLENILLEDKNEPLNIKLIDFSSACNYTSNKSIIGMIGSLYYIAPEVLTGPYNQKCDLWSCGVIIYLLLAGHPPFDGNTDTETIELIKRGKYDLDGAEMALVSSEAKDLISKLLSPASSRISAAEALKHPWFSLSYNKSNPEVHVIESALGNLRNFQSMNKLRDAVHTFVTTQLIESKDVAELREVFRKIDKNGDGILTRQELLEEYSKHKGPEEAQAEVDKIMSEVDTDNNGTIDYTEFLKASMNSKTLLSSEHLRIAFNMFDKDHNGTISASEMRKVLEGGIDSADSVWREIIREVDQNGDGEIDFQEFQDILLSKL